MEGFYMEEIRRPDNMERITTPELAQAFIDEQITLLRKQIGSDKVLLALSGGVGVCFGCCNLLNTTLAGMLASAILFPTLNIGVILLTTLCGLVFLKEKITARVIGVLALGVASILLLNLS